MKKIISITTLFIVVIILGLLLMHVQKLDTEVTKNQTKVLMLLNGKLSDKSWGQSHYEGMQKCAAELNLAVAYEEEAPADGKAIALMEEYIENGYKIVICNSFDFSEEIIEVANNHPDVFFFHATGVVQNHNLSTYFGRMYQMRYLSGIVAGLQTETNAIGYVASFPIVEVNRGINAFTLGVKAVNPDASVYVSWSDSWTDDDANRKSAERLIDTYHVDVLSMHCDTISPLDVADERGIWSIGYNMDNSELYPDSFLTAPIWKWEYFYTPKIMECLQGKFRSKQYWEDVSTGIIDLAPFTKNVKKGTQERIQQELNKLNTGTYDVFYGPIKNQKGDIVVEMNENMSDYNLLNSFDWYVEGVKIDE